MLVVCHGRRGKIKKPSSNVKKKSLIMNKYYFITSKPNIEMGQYSNDRLGMVIDLDPEFTSHFSGLFGASKNFSDKWVLNGELNIQLENIWNTMESFSFFWRKLDSTNQVINLKLSSPHFFDNGMGINSYYKYDLVDGFLQNSRQVLILKLLANHLVHFFLDTTQEK